MPAPLTGSFADRHIGPAAVEVQEMLVAVGADSLEDLIARVVPADIRLNRFLALPEAVSEAEALRELRGIASRNRMRKSLIGLGYHDCITPPVIRRNLFENPGWYTSYTPYQPEISQGRLELLFHFQTLVCELAGHPVANASLLDQASAVAEAAAMAVRRFRRTRDEIVVAGDLHPQDRDVLETRAYGIGLRLTDGPPGPDTAAVLIPWPDTLGVFRDPEPAVEAARDAGAMTIAVADPLALVLLQPPAEWGADIVVGSMQRFGVPMGCGGPHAAFIATGANHVRLTPGRIVGEAVDAAGRVAYRLALQTREQHIRREKATSNICTAQALLANIAAAFAIWHGPEGLTRIAERTHGLAARLTAGARVNGSLAEDGPRFDTVVLKRPADAAAAALRERGYDLRVVDPERLSVTFDETSGEAELAALSEAFGFDIPATAPPCLPSARRGEGFLSQPAFHAHRSETAMMRYLRSLADKDLALDRTMIPLGSCTMKLNAAAEMEPVSWPEFAGVHPFAPRDAVAGYDRLATDLEAWLAEISGFDAVSLQPNAGSQGELAGLLAIRRFHDANGNPGRDLCLIPESAHGTNPASANLAGLAVLTVKSRPSGEVDLDDLEALARKYRDRLAACMVTYPSTRGVFEAGIVRLCDIVHEYGGQVYLDGANLNAIAGNSRPGDFGADICHMNLHKTFCIPHGGGGPGVGPVGAKAHLAPYFPGHWTLGRSGAVSGARLGSAGILPISWMYIRMMGAAGLWRASAVAILNANYVARRLADRFPTAFHGDTGYVAHECILDPRPYRASAGVTAVDIAKRLIDYGFHGPTMEWPVVGTLMAEPTESESKPELDRFCDAMLAIADEIGRVESGEWPRDDNPLVNAPHTVEEAVGEKWDHPYSRSLAIRPMAHGPGATYSPPVSRVDNAYGDRNLVCACPPVLAENSDQAA